ncbi:MAG: hypothetical protein KY455_13995 [Euryarchaeota archaeon]|nr:hypothetical protein [Euryarchaeota archaeon]
MSKKILVSFVVAFTLAFAGCHEQADQDPPGDGGQTATDTTDTATPDPQDPPQETGTLVTLVVLSAPETVQAGEEFQVEVNATWNQDGTTSAPHAGAHWGRNSTADRDASTLRGSDFDGKSPHPGTTIPGEYTITGWSFATPGTYYYRAHAQIEVDGVMTDFWGDEQTITVQ